MQNITKKTHINPTFMLIRKSNSAQPIAKPHPNYHHKNTHISKVKTFPQHQNQIKNQKPKIKKNRYIIHHQSMYENLMQQTQNQTILNQKRRLKDQKSKQQKALDILHQLSLTDINPLHDDPTIISAWFRPHSFQQNNPRKRRKQNMNQTTIQALQTKQNINYPSILQNKMKFKINSLKINEQNNLGKNGRLRNIRQKFFLGKNYFLKDFSNLLGRQKIPHY